MHGQAWVVTMTARVQTKLRYSRHAIPKDKILQDKVLHSNPTICYEVALIFLHIISSPYNKAAGSHIFQATSQVGDKCIKWGLCCCLNLCRLT